MAIPLRASFRETVTGDGVIYVWLAFDILCDLIYLMDAMLVQPRLCNEGCSGLNLKVGLVMCVAVLKKILWILPSLLTLSGF